MESIKGRVAIIGMDCTQFGERWDVGLNDLAIEAAYEAYRDAGVGPEDIQACYLGTVTAPMIGVGGTVVADALKRRGIPIIQNENWCATGHIALIEAHMAVARGVYDVVMALGVEKLKDTGFPGLGTGRGMHPVYEPRDSLAILARERCTAVGAIQTMYTKMMEDPALDRGRLFLRTGWTTRPPQTPRDIYEKMGVTGITNLYGISEASPCCSISDCLRDPWKTD